VGALTSSLTLRNPALLVLAAQTLHDISSGRAELALGAGGAPLDHELTGVPSWSPSERAERFAEFVPAVARMLREPGPGAGGVRLTVGALGPRSIALAARHADAWNSYGVPTGKRLTTRLSHEEALALFRERAGRLERACVEAGRDPATVGKSYTWVESYTEPALLDVATCTGVARDFRDSGANEFVLYWPADESQAERLGDMVRVLHEL
jgi:alkanesulfonate monooxygenase SsuD/methylene tetrahydromethanopterin reductase-like flavin-dependent oxidoreductase (luciferase family)